MSKLVVFSFSHIGFDFGLVFLHLFRLWSRPQTLVSPATSQAGARNYLFNWLCHINCAKLLLPVQAHGQKAQLFQLVVSQHKCIRSNTRALQLRHASCLLCCLEEESTEARGRHCSSDKQEHIHEGALVQRNLAHHLKMNVFRLLAIARAKLSHSLR